MSPLERAQLLVQTAKGMLAAGQLPGARDAATQAQLIATQTPDLLPAQRGQDLRRTAKRWRAVIKDPAFAAKVDDLARNPFLSPQGVLIPHRIDTFGERLPYDDAITAAISAREQAATLLADRIALTNGVDIDPERQALAQALLAEDQARSQFYQQARGGAVSLPQQTWLLLRPHRVAGDEVADCTAGLRHFHPARSGNSKRARFWPNWMQGHNDYAAALDAAAAALPTPGDQALQRVENQMWLARQAERGLYTSIGVTDLSERLRIVQDDVASKWGRSRCRWHMSRRQRRQGFRSSLNLDSVDFWHAHVAECCT